MATLITATPQMSYLLRSVGEAQQSPRLYISPWTGGYYLAEMILDGKSCLENTKGDMACRQSRRAQPKQFRVTREGYLRLRRICTCTRAANYKPERGVKRKVCRVRCLRSTLQVQGQVNECIRVQLQFDKTMYCVSHACYTSRMTYVAVWRITTVTYSETK